MGKKFVLVTFALMFSLFVMNFFFLNGKIYQTAKSGFTVVIDPGHGGIDPGVLGATTKEKESNLNLYLSKNLYDNFYAEGVNCVLTRTQDVGLYGTISKGFKERDLKKRVQIAKSVNADIFISIHMNNYADENRRGAQVFYNPKSEQSKKLAKLVQDNLNGMEESVRICEPLAGDYYLLNNLTCPAIIVECGFLSNPLDEKLLTTDSYRNKLAHSIYYGVICYLYNEKI